jgi:isoleucyl-tRNA synthetase
VRYAAPVLVFTSEEVWQTRFGADADSVHFSDWPEVPTLRHSREGGNPSPGGDVWTGQELDPRLREGDAFKLKAKWADIRSARSLVTEAIEPFRRDKTIGSSLQAEVVLSISDDTARSHCSSEEMAEIAITSSCHIASGTDSVIVTKTTNHKCGRCWRHLPEVTEDGALCGRCADVVGG